MKYYGKYWSGAQSGWYFQEKQKFEHTHMIEVSAIQPCEQMICAHAEINKTLDYWKGFCKDCGVEVEPTGWAPVKKDEI